MKLTLSVRADVVRQAKRLAKRHATSVSAMFERLVRTMAKSRHGERTFGPLTRKASGVIAVPKGKTDRQLLEEALAKHHVEDETAT
jgi:hypothetical protein